MNDGTGDEPNNGDQGLGNLRRSGNPSDKRPELVDGIRDESDNGPDIGTYAKPEKTEEEKLDEEDVKGFLAKKGAVEILAQLADGPKRFGEIDDALVVSHGTVATRLTEGAKVGLWREFIYYREDGGKMKLYQLYPRAEPLAESAKDVNIRETTEYVRKATAQHADALSEFRDEIETNIDE